MTRPSRVLLVVFAVGACAEPTVPDRAVPYQFVGAEGHPAEGHVFRWPDEHLPVRFHLTPRQALRPFVEEGLRAWEAQFLYGEFRGMMTDDSATADVLVRFTGEVTPGTPTGSVPAPGVCPRAETSLPPTDSSRQLTGPIRILVQAEPDMPATAVADCLQIQVAHELGHALGILAHSDEDDLMHANPQTLLPTVRDRATVQALYQTPATLWPMPRPR